MCILHSPGCRRCPYPRSQAGARRSFAVGAEPHCELDWEARRERSVFGDATLLHYDDVDDRSGEETAIGQREMTRKTPLMMTLAILAVVLAHASSWGMNAMVWWTDQYRNVDAIPCWEAVGTLPYYVLMTIKQLTFFAVPTFLFVSGYFVAYAMRRASTTANWRFARTRVLSLLWPYLVWSLVIFVADGLEGEIHTPMEYLRQLVFGGAVVPFFFVPLLCQLYLLSPFLVRWSNRNSLSLLGVSGFLHLALIVGVTYLRLAGPETPYLTFAPAWFFPWRMFYFVLGIVYGLNVASIHKRLRRFRWSLLCTLVVLAIITVYEAELLYRWSGDLEWGYSGSTLPTVLYNSTFLMCFMAFGKIRVPSEKAVRYLSTRTYGIYLMFPMIQEMVARAVYHVAPWVLGYQILFQPLLVISTVGVPLLLMILVGRSPMRGAYKYLFG